MNRLNIAPRIMMKHYFVLLVGLTLFSNIKVRAGQSVPCAALIFHLSLRSPILIKEPPSEPILLSPTAGSSSPVLWLKPTGDPDWAQAVFRTKKPARTLPVFVDHDFNLGSRRPIKIWTRESLAESGLSNFYPNMMAVIRYGTSIAFLNPEGEMVNAQIVGDTINPRLHFIAHNPSDEFLAKRVHHLGFPTSYRRAAAQLPLLNPHYPPVLTFPVGNSRQLDSARRRNYEDYGADQTSRLLRGLEDSNPID